MTLRLPRAVALACLPFAAGAAFAMTPADPETEKKDVPAEEAAKKQEKVAKEEKTTCRSIAADMSSRRRTKVCKTKEGWKEWRRAQRGRYN
ncbi:MAG: hypothetical protein SXU28_13330 [Pseudomonadota bacterium]|nr:hypothetical protein [Pseudomonadota bacterium]